MLFTAYYYPILQHHMSQLDGFCIPMDETLKKKKRTMPAIHLRDVNSQLIRTSDFERKEEIRVDEYIGIDLSSPDVVYSWAEEAAAVSSVVKGHLYRIVTSSVAHSNLFHDDLLAFFRSIYKDGSYAPAQGGVGKQMQANVNDRFIATMSGTPRADFSYIPLKAFQVNSMPYGGPSKVAVSRDGIRTAVMRSATITVDLDIYDRDGTAIVTSTKALVTFTNISDTRFTAASIKKIGVEDWDNKELRLKPLSGIGSSTNLKLGIGTSSDELTLLANMEPLLQRIVLIMTMHQKDSALSFFPQASAIGATANEAVGASATLDSAVIQYALVTFPSVEVARFEPSEQQSHIGYRYAGFKTRGSGYNKNAIYLFGVPSVLQLGIEVTGLSDSIQFIPSSNSTSLFQSANNLTSKWSYFSVRSVGKEGGNWSSATTTTVSQQFEKLLFRVFNRDATSFLMDATALDQSIRHEPTDGLNMTSQGKIVENLFVENHWNSSLSAVADNLRFTYVSDGDMQCFLDDVTEVSVQLTLQSAGNLATTLIRLKLPTVSGL